MSQGTREELADALSQVEGELDDLEAKLQKAKEGLREIADAEPHQPVEHYGYSHDWTDYNNIKMEVRRILQSLDSED